MGREEHLTHLLFVDNMLILCYCIDSKGRVLKDILEILCDATCMIINVQKFSIYFPIAEEGVCQVIDGIFNFSSFHLSDKLKYLGFLLNPNNYSILDWKWILT
jgi:hypothetical protein